MARYFSASMLEKDSIRIKKVISSMNMSARVVIHPGELLLVLPRLTRRFGSAAINALRQACRPWSSRWRASGDR